MFDLFEEQNVSQDKLLQSNRLLPAASEHSSKFRTSIMSSSLPVSAFPGLGNLKMSAFMDRSNIHPSLKHAECDDMFKDCNLNDQGGDSEEDELLTVHFGDVTTACNREIIEVDSEEESNDGILFVCSVCAVVCENLHSLKQHEMTHSEDTPTAYTEAEIDPDVMFVCGVCTVVCENLQSLKQHEMTHSEEVATTYSEDQDTGSEAENSENNMFVCSVCNVVCNSLHSLKRHETTHLEGICTLYSGDQNTHVSEAETNENNMFICSVCSMVCENSISLRHHEVTHSEDVGMAYSEPENMVYSEGGMDGDNMFVCGVCSLVFKNVQCLLRHEMVHSDERPYKCSFCNYAGKLKENLLAHMNTHTRAKQFKCQYCDYTSIKSHSLKLHQQFHTNLYQHKCSLCLYSTATIGSLSSHYKNHHHKNTELTSDKTLAFSNSSSDKCSPVLNSGAHGQEKSHKCPYCDYSSKKAYSLKMHLQQHTDKFPNKCHLCLYSTANAGNLTSHYKNHHLNYAEGQYIYAEELEPSEPNLSEANSEIYLEELSPIVEKPYKCQYCEYSAPKPCRIRDHMQYHTDTFPNKCHLCLYSTNRAGNLLYHYRYHHYSNTEALALAAEPTPPAPVVHKYRQETHLAKPSLVQENVYKCELCEYIAAKPHRLKAHLHFHTYKYQNKCRLCVYSTASLGNLTSHYKKHHRSITKGKNSIEELVDAEADRRSSLCGQLRSLTVHLERIPERKNYFVCDVCQKIFMKKLVLTEHRKTHLEIYKYQCDICECSFCESELLETHKQSQHKEEVKQPTISSEIRNALLCKMKLSPVKRYPMRSDLKKVSPLRSKLQLKKRQTFKTNSLHITANKLQQHCKLVLRKLGKTNSLRKEIQCQSGITNADKRKSCISLSKSNEDKQALTIPPRSVSNANGVLQQHGKRWSLRNSVVKITSTKPEVISKLRLHKCLLCEFAGTSLDSLKIHNDSHHKEEAGLKSHREFNRKEGRSLKLRNEHDHRADVSLTMHNESNLKGKTNLRPNTSYERGELNLRLNTESKQKVMYSCTMCSYTCRRVKDFKEHMVEHSSTERENSGLDDEEAETSAELHYACDMCSFSCDREELLHQHLSVHDEERKQTLHHCLPGNEEEIASSSKKTVLYKCILCSRKSSDVESMTKHMLTCNTKKGLW